MIDGIFGMAKAPCFPNRRFCVSVIKKENEGIRFQFETLKRLGTAQ